MSSATTPVAEAPGVPGVPGLPSSERLCRADASTVAQVIGANTDAPSMMIDGRAVGLVQQDGC